MVHANRPLGNASGKEMNMLDEATRNMLRQTLGMSDKDIGKLQPGMTKLLSSASEVAKYRIIAEVTDSKYCRN